MSKYDSLRAFQFASSDEKLAILRHELLREITLVNGFTFLLRQSFNEGDLSNDSSEDWKTWVSEIANANNNMQEILDILTRTSG